MSYRIFLCLLSAGAALSEAMGVKHAGSMSARKQCPRSCPLLSASTTASKGKVGIKDVHNVVARAEPSPNHLGKRDFGKLIWIENETSSDRDIRVGRRDT